LEQQLRNGETGLDGGALLARNQTLIWRQAFSALMVQDTRKSSALFSLHRAQARPHTNQEAINWVYGRVLPALISGGPAEVDHLGDALAATQGYEVANLTSRFTHPHIALVQRDLLHVVAGLRRQDWRSCYRYLWRAGLALKDCRATPAAEGIAEFMTILQPHLPEATQMIKAATFGWSAVDRLIARASRGGLMNEALVMALEEQMDGKEAAGNTPAATEAPDSGGDVRRIAAAAVLNIRTGRWIRRPEPPRTRTLF
jgi:hypothetical protein